VTSGTFNRGRGCYALQRSVSNCVSLVFANSLIAMGRHYGTERAIRWALPCICSFYRATAMLSAVYAVVVCVSVTLRYCIKTAKRRITQITTHDSPFTHFCDTKVHCEIRKITPYGGDKCRWGGLKFVTFDKKRAITRKPYKIDT